LYETAPIAYFSVGKDGQIRRANARAGQLLGCPAEEVVGAPVAEIYADTPQNKEIAETVFQRFLAGEVIQDEELQMRKVDGTPIWVALSVTPIVDAGGKVIASRSMAVDITERKRAQEALRKSENQARSIIETANDPFIAMDEGGRITDWNPQAEVVFGWSRSEAVGRHRAKTVIPSEHHESHQRGLTRFLSTGQGQMLGKQIELIAFRRDGSLFPVELTISAARTGDTWMFYAFICDITERKLLLEQLNQAQKMEVVGQLAGGVAHDFNNLLTPILGFSQMASDSLAREHPTREYLQHIHGAAERASALTQRLLTFSRRQAAEPGLVNLN
jgi:PAS domain S-box-containing protein